MKNLLQKITHDKITSLNDPNVTVLNNIYITSDFNVVTKNGTKHRIEVIQFNYWVSSFRITDISRHNGKYWNITDLKELIGYIAESKDSRLIAEMSYLKLEKVFDIKLPFGKYKGQQMSEISWDLKYLTWLSEKNANQNIAQLASYAHKREMIIFLMGTVLDIKIMRWAKQNTLSFENFFKLLPLITGIELEDCASDHFAYESVVKAVKVATILMSRILTEYYGTNDGDEEIDF